MNSSRFVFISGWKHLMCLLFWRTSLSACTHLHRLSFIGCVRRCGHVQLCSTRAYHLANRWIFVSFFVQVESSNYVWPAFLWSNLLIWSSSLWSDKLKLLIIGLNDHSVLTKWLLGEFGLRLQSIFLHNSWTILSETQNGSADSWFRQTKRKKRPI